MLKEHHRYHKHFYDLFSNQIKVLTDAASLSPDFKNYM